MKDWYLVLLISHFLATAFAVSAQPDIPFTRISTKDGLSGDIVYSLLQDRNGFLWIGTHRGLNRFDGYHFRYYQNDPEDNNSLSSNHILNIREDSEGALWLTTPNGLNSLNPVTSKVKRFFPADTTISKDIRDIYLVNDSIILLTSGSGILLFNKKINQFSRIEISKEFTRYYFNRNKFCCDKNDNIYLDNLFGNLVLIDWRKGAGTILSPKSIAPAIPPGFPIYRIQRFFYDNKGNAWYCYTGEDASLHICRSGTSDSFSMQISLESNVREISIYEDNSNHIWFCTASGLVLYDYHSGKFSVYSHQSNNSESLGNSELRCMLADQHGVYWVGSFGSGLSRFQLTGNTFKHINLLPTGNRANNMVGSLRTLHDGKIYVERFDGSPSCIFNTYHVLEKMDPKYRTPEAIFYEATRISLNSLPEKELKFIEKALWEGNVYSNFLIDHSGRIWNRWWRGFSNSDTAIEFASKVGPVILTREATFLVGSEDGLKVFNYKNLTTEDLLPERPGSFNLKGKIIHDFIQDQNGNYWIATATEGLVFWDASQKQFIQYTVKKGLPDNTIYKIIPDSKGHLWISTNNGITSLDTASKTFTNYTIVDGLINTEYNRGSACIDSNGYIYFGGMNGLDYFHPDSISTEKKSASVILSAFKLFGRQQPLSSSYSLATGDNSFSFEFTGNDFLATKKIFFRYRLIGAEKDWNLLQGINSAHYNKLPPGKYHFTVQSSYDNKTWGVPLNILIIIAIPWYNTWWFYGIILFSLSSIIYALFRYRLQQKLRVLQIRNRLHRDLHDDVGATLSSVKAYSEILRDKPDNPLIAELISINSTEMIERLEVIAWATNPEHDNFKSLKNKMEKFAKPLCHSKGIDCEIKSEGLNEEMQMPGEVRQNIFLFFKEAINNMMKYSAASTCSIIMSLKQSRFELQVKDNGKGFDNMADDSGNGIKNMHKRAAELNGNLTVNSKSGAGTVITMYLPYPFKIPSSWYSKKGRK